MVLHEAWTGNVRYARPARPKAEGGEPEQPSNPACDAAYHIVAL